ncbi:MAG: InlB B-repeat-containing protein [Oscillospiraceae bacterium]
MKKRILSILLLCCMVLTLLPTTAFAADELPDVKLSIPTTFDKTVYLTNQKKELKITDSKTYLIKGSADPNWYFQYRIKIDGGRKKITPHIFLDGVRLQAPKDGPAIELYGGASACLYFIGNDSELIGAENFAALQKNKTDGHLRVLVQTGTKLTCEGGRYGAGIGGSKVGIKKFSQGHGMNLHFGSLATDIYGGEILATSGVYGAGIGGGQGGVGEQIYVYSGKLMVRSVSEGAGIGGGQGGPGRFIYIKGGTVNAGSESGGAGIGSGDQDGQNKSEDAHHIEISGGTVEAWSNYAGAGIGGGRDGSGYDISITGGVVRAQGYFGAGIGGGMNGNSGNILIKDTTLTALALPLYSSPDYTALSASAVGRGSNRVHYQIVMQDQEFAMSIEENIKIGASNGKSVWLSATGWQWRHNQEPKKYWYWDTTTELLIPNENGRVDLQRLSLPYAYNYGRVISKLELRCEESTCSHEFGWAIRDDCHIWACMKCGARDPAAEMSKQNGKHIPGDWSNQKQLCTVCDHVLERDTKAPVMETLTDGESYTVEDTLDGKPGAYTFTVIDPAASGETSSGVKSVTINGVEQDGPTYRLPAPDGGNNDAGAEYTVVATDNAGNETTATVRTYRRHHEHSYGDWSKDGTSHWHECADADCPDRDESIKDKATHVYADDADTICNVCGYERTVTPPAHEHSYGDWSKDGTSHWHECTDADCPNREESIKDKAAHVYTDDADTTCDVCGYERTVTPPAHEHSYGDWSKDGTSHWHECTDIECPNREESITDKAAHVYTDDTDTTCNVCGYERTVTPPSHEHSYGDWSKDGTSHWHECADADCPNRNESIKDKAAHVYTDDADTTCNVCGYERTVTPPAPTEFIVTFDGNGGTGSMEPVTVEEGSRYVLPACGFTAPDGQEFKAWEIGGVEYNAGDGYVVLGNTEIKALWKDSAVIPTTFTITFNANGGTGSMEPVTVEEGSRYVLPACGFTAPAGQEFKAWEIGGIEYNAGDDYVVLGNTEIKALWKDSAVIPTTFTITFNANGGTGSMEPVTVEEGSRYVLPACGFTAPDGQEFKAWEIGGVEYNAGDGYVVLGNTEIKALWKDSAVIPTTFTITFNANGGTGSMEPVTVEEGSRYPLPACGFIPPVNMQFSGWALSAGGSVIADGAIMVTSNITLYAIWEPVPVNEFVVFFDGNGGTPAVSSMTTIGHRLAFLPGAFRSGSYRFDGWYTERNGGELIATSTVFAANTIVYAHWTYTGGSGGSGGYVPGYYIIRATAGAGGSITPSGDVSVRAGANQTFTITPNRGYAVSDVKIDGRSIGAVRSYTFENISASHTIEVQFRVRSSFVDVPSGSYYEDAVDWAVANGITTGMDAAHFSPDGICTRAQAVTFLWRAAGRPAPESRTMPFTDVPADSYYYDAVLWAVENGITKGTSSTTFSPDDTCTRAQIVTFLWRSEQSPAAGSSNPFTDVSADAYYADAVLWAVKEAITTGTTRTTFSPDAECTRAQIVTFLWRCKK